MSNRSSKNAGVQLLAEFAERAIPLTGASASQASDRPGSRSTNAGIALLETFRDRAASMRGEANTLDPSEASGQRNAAAGPSCLLELVVKLDFRSLSEEEQQRLLDALRRLLCLDREIDIREQTQGAVKLTAEVSSEEAEKLYHRVCGSIDWAAIVDISLLPIGAANLPQSPEPSPLDSTSR